MMLNDNELKGLLVRTARGDQAAFSALYEKSAPVLLSVANRIVGRKELGEEVLHDVFVKVWHKSREFDPKVTQVTAWLIAMTRNRALDLVASANVSKMNLVDTTDEAVQTALDVCLGQADLSDRSDNPLDAEEARQSIGHLRHCIEALKPEEKQMVALAYYHGMSHQALSDHLDRPLGTVKTVCRRAMARLKECVEQCTSGGAR